ncbi:hypothetical protein QAD02_013009 [Eretmocerus hayati]|uniref:Uncharacterized protein n=1 Tax=Eretmocerus hayati TaxID=131215 RepID=A0ACC2P1G2_9HYME|nr:hypothetical protein QAD02_013009 [Eretmocerus hayati]
MIHRSPSAPAMRDSWLRAINQNDVPKWVKICSDHLKKDDFGDANRKDGEICRMLKENAAPSVNLFKNSEQNISNDPSCVIRVSSDVTNSAQHLDNDPANVVPVANDIQLQDSVLVSTKETERAITNLLEAAPEQVQYLHELHNESEDEDWEDFGESMEMDSPLVSRKR